MGVNMRQYVIFGVKVPYDRRLSELLDESDYDHDQQTYNGVDGIVMDGMGGAYTVLGHVVFKGPDLRWGYPDGEFTVIEPLTLFDDWLKWRVKFLEQFPECADLVDDTNPKLMMFMHFS